MYHVPRMALPIHIFRHFGCRMYRLATNAVGKKRMGKNEPLKLLQSLEYDKVS